MVVVRIGHFLDVHTVNQDEWAAVGVRHYPMQVVMSLETNYLCACTHSQAGPPICYVTVALEPGACPPDWAVPTDANAVCGSVDQPAGGCTVGIHLIIPSHYYMFNGPTGWTTGRMFEFGLPVTVWWPARWCLGAVISQCDAGMPQAVDTNAGTWSCTDAYGPFGNYQTVNCP